MINALINLTKGRVAPPKQIKGGVKARLEYFRKFIRFGNATRP